LEDLSKIDNVTDTVRCTTFLRQCIYKDKKVDNYLPVWHSLQTNGAETEDVDDTQMA